MDEPTSALDPISTLKIEDLMGELKKNYTDPSKSFTVATEPKLFFFFVVQSNSGQFTAS